MFSIVPAVVEKLDIFVTRHPQLSDYVCRLSVVNLLFILLFSMIETNSRVMAFQNSTELDLTLDSPN